MREESQKTLCAIYIFNLSTCLRFIFRRFYCRRLIFSRLQGLKRRDGHSLGVSGIAFRCGEDNLYFHNLRKVKRFQSLSSELDCILYRLKSYLLFYKMVRLNDNFHTSLKCRHNRWKSPLIGLANSKEYILQRTSEKWLVE